MVVHTFKNEFKSWESYKSFSIKDANQEQMLLDKNALMNPT